MASQGYATLRSLPDPLAHSGGGTSSLAVSVVAPMTVQWSDGPTDAYPVVVGGVAQRACLSLYAGHARTVDGSAAVWLVILSHGTPNPWLVQERDFGTIGTLVDGVGGGEWAVIARIDGSRRYKMPQV